MNSINPVSAYAIGDLHYKISNIRETDTMVEAIIVSVTEIQPDIIIVLGDVLNSHDVIHVSPLTRAISFLARLMRIAPVYVLIGNHDLKNNRQFLSDEHPFTALKFWGSNMTIVDTTMKVTIKGQIFVFVPYVPPGRFEEALNHCQGWETASCIFAHQEFRGARMGALISTEGDIWPLTNRFVVSGHLHDYQEPQDNILYTGTPIQHAFGDHHDKTISYFTFRSPNDRDHQRIDLRLPRKFIVRLTCAEVTTYVPRDNCELKIIIRGTSGELKAIKNHINVGLWKKQGYKIIYKDLPNSQSDQTEILNPISRAPLKFSTIFYQTISSHPRLEPLYARIFVGDNSVKLLANRVGNVRLDN